MTNRLTALLILAVLFAGCRTDDPNSTGHDCWCPFPGLHTLPAEPAPTPEPDPAEPQSFVFTWKPIADTRHGVAVVIISAEYRHKDFRGLIIRGHTDQVAERPPGYGNGDRIHNFLRHTGALYGTNFLVHLIATDPARNKTVLIPDGAARYDVEL